MDITFAGKRALVTGAGKGIGRAVALALAAGGAETVAVSRTQADLDSLKQECSSIETICVDMADWDNTKAAIECAGEFDLLVNNAGVGGGTSFLEVTPEDFDRMFNTNVKAVINVSQVVAKGMISRGKGGSIVNVSSQGSKVALHDHTLYCGTKGALDQITRCMALELGPHQIRVNSVNPTITMTPMGKEVWGPPEKSGPALAKIPLGKFAEVDDVVSPILYLLSDQAAMVHGSCMMVDGGWTIW